jgi:uncharacterized protein (TIGR03437 family)
MYWLEPLLYSRYRIRIRQGKCVFKMKKLVSVLAMLGGVFALQADVALQAAAGGDVVSGSFTVTANPRDFFDLTPDGGATGTPAPAWLSVDQTSGYTDAAVNVFADPAKLQAGTYTARIVVMFGSNSNTVIQNVTLTVSAAQPKVDISPTTIALSAPSVNGVNQADSIPIYLRNIGGGGPQAFTAAIVGDSSYLTLSATSGQTDLTHPAFTVTASTKGTLNAKAYSATVIRVTSGTFNQDIPVTFLVTPSPLSFGVTKLGLRFLAQQGVGTQQTQTINVPAGSGTINWSVTISSAQDFVSVTPSTGTSKPGASPGVITVGIKPNSLKAGDYYALITVTPSDPGVSPVLATVVYSVSAGTAYPTFSPAGLVFVAPLNVTADPPAQSIPLYASTSIPQNFTVGQGGNLFDSITESGTVTGSAPAQIQVTPAYYVTSKPGIFRGNLQVKFAALGITRNTDILYVVLPAGAKPGASEARAVTGCTPTQIALLATALSGGFSQPAGFPGVISTRVIDDCSNPVTNAKVVLSFNNGDSPLVAALEDSTTGTYTATWVPVRPAGSVIVTARAVAGTFSASLMTNGVVPSQVAPNVAFNGTLNNLNAHVGAPLAPGIIAEIFGSALSATTGTPSQLPLPTTFQNTSVTIAGFAAPLYFVSDGQLDAQLPAELSPNASYPLVVTNGNAISVPQMVTVTDVAPGVAATADGQTIAQHANFAYVTPANPAKPGEVLIIYLVGLGATNPAVKSGTAAPGVEPLARLVNANAATVMVDGENANVAFAGLTPGAVGLYQIDFTVPSDAKTGNLNIVVTQNGVTANTSTIPVSR